MSKENNNGTVPLSYEQERALELMLSGRNVFLTGEAGTGKSAIIHEFKRRYQGNLACLAPTWLAARNIDGVSLNPAFPELITIDPRHNP